MTGVAEIILAGGVQEIGSAVPKALLVAVAVLTVVLLALRVVLGRRTRRAPLVLLPPLPECPCCTGEPFRVNDCTCREDCGVHWCQAADDDTLDVPDWLKESGGRG